MKQTTRDNLIYLAIGLSIAALLAVDAFYSISHNRKMWMPSRLSLIALAWSGVLIYMVARETRKVGATLVQTLACVFVACFLHAGIVLGFSQFFAKPSSVGLWISMVLELFLIVRLMVRVILYLRPKSLRT